MNNNILAEILEALFDMGNGATGLYDNDADDETIDSMTDGREAPKNNERPEKIVCLTCPYLRERTVAVYSDSKTWTECARYPEPVILNVNGKLGPDAHWCGEHPLFQGNA